MKTLALVMATLITGTLAGTLAGTANATAPVTDVRQQVVSYAASPSLFRRVHRAAETDVVGAIVG